MKFLMFYFVTSAKSYFLVADDCHGTFYSDWCFPEVEVAEQLISGFIHKPLTSRSNFKTLSGGKIERNKTLVDAEGGYSPVGSVDVHPCPDGTFSYNKGLQYPWECLNCPPGTYCQNGQIRLCPTYPNYASNEGAKSEDDCFPCPSGMQCWPGEPHKELF